jgi:hypothetical protein
MNNKNTPAMMDTGEEDTINKFISVTNNSKQQQTVKFGESSEIINTISAIPDKTFLSANNDDFPLDKFFERPILVKQFVWTPNDVDLNESFNPWQLFFNNPRVSNRISNYALMHCNLNIKFLINGNIFYFGRMLIDYIPLHNYDQLSGKPVYSSAAIVQASQRLHVKLDPNTSIGAQMKLPYLLNTDMAVLSNNQIENNGIIVMRTLNSLKHANNSTTPLNISVYVWATDIKLSAPTSINSYSIVPQAGEYGNSVVSNTMSKISATAKVLQRIPIISPYATATSEVASTLGDAASALGYSRPIDIQEPPKYQPQYVNNLSSTDTRDTSNKMTVDSKQELSIDSRVTGLSGKDELIISDISSKESFLDTFNWNINTPISTTLFTTRVTPQVLRVYGNGVFLPACAFATLPFKFWRGQLTFRFEIVCTPFHRGRILFVFDPLFVLPSIEANTIQSHIVDISTQKDFSITIGWAQNKTFLPTRAITTSANSQDHFVDGTTFTNTSEFANGVLSAHVLNNLTVANENAPEDIKINVYVSCKDLEVAVPTHEHISTYAFVAQAENFVSQSGDVLTESLSEESKPSDDNIVDNMSTPIPQNNDIYGVYMGEKIISFRPLLKRYTFNEAHVIKAINAPALSKCQRTNCPMFMGKWEMSPYSTTVVQGNTNLFTYLFPAFLQVRGSMRHKYLFQTDTSFDVHTFIQKSITPATKFWVDSNIALDISDNDFIQYNYFSYVHPGVSGMVMAPKLQQPVLEVELPYQQNYRFDCTRCIDYKQGEDNSYRYTRHSHLLYVTHLKLDVIYLNFFAVGEDFNLSLFQGCPYLGYRPTLVPT